MNNLPVVKSQTCCSVEQSLYGKDDNDYLAEQIDKIEIENPIIAEFIKKFSKKTKDPFNVMFGSLMVYKLLSSQAEADQLNEMFI